MKWAQTRAGENMCLLSYVRGRCTAVHGAVRGDEGERERRGREERVTACLPNGHRPQIVVCFPPEQ